MYFKKISGINTELTREFHFSRGAIESHIEQLRNMDNGDSILDTTSTYFGTTANHSYYYRAGSFRNKDYYLYQINSLKKPVLFSELTGFINSIIKEPRVSFNLYSVTKANGTYGVGLKNSIQEGDRLILSSLKDIYGKANFSLFISHELFEHLTRRNSADIADLDLFIIYELIWQELLRHYFSNASPEVITKIKEYLISDVRLESAYQHELDPQHRVVLNNASGWDAALEKDELYIRALARKLSGTQDSMIAGYVGWREFGSALLMEISNDLAKRSMQISYNGRLLVSFNTENTGTKLTADRTEPSIGSDNSALSKIDDSEVGRSLELTDVDVSILRYLWGIRSIAGNYGVEREYKLSGSALPEPIRKALAFLEVASFPPVGADFFSGEVSKGTRTFVFTPNVSFSFRGKKKTSSLVEITITVYNDPFKSPQKTVLLPVTAGFEDALITIIAELPGESKNYFFNTSIKGFSVFADKLLKKNSAAQVKILKEFANYIDVHASQSAFNEALPLGTAEVGPLTLAYELVALADNVQFRQAALAALESFKKVFPGVKITDALNEQNPSIPQ